MAIHLDNSSIISLTVLTAIGVWWVLTRRLRPPAFPPDALPLPTAPPPEALPSLPTECPEPVAAAPIAPALLVLEERLRRLEAALPDAPALPALVEAPRPPRPVAPPDAALDARLARLLKAGTPVPEIACAFNCSRAEVELLLALRRTPADPPPDHGQMPLPL